MSRRRPAPPTGLAVAFTASGVVHFVRPQFFEPIMPRWIPAEQHRRLIYLSGVVELLCAVGLLRRSRWAPAASVATLVAVFPANVQMALDAGTGRHPGAMDKASVAWGRLPLQAVMIWAALRGRSGSGGDG